MKERPILFSAPMVRAILAGTKTQTRRMCKPAEAEVLCEIVGPFDDETGTGWFGDAEGDVKFACPYGVPGDRLWVRETFCVWGDGRIEYRANPEFADTRIERDWKPSIHMPRWASRILLEIVSVRVERLQDISEADAIAEGTPGGHGAIKGYGYNVTAIEHYRWLWESLNGPWSWNDTRWVWVIEFKRVTP